MVSRDTRRSSHALEKRKPQTVNIFKHPFVLLRVKDYTYMK